MNLKQKNGKEIIIKDGIIPNNYIDLINNNNKISFIVCSNNSKELEKTISTLMNLQKKYKDKDFKVLIFSSYKKLSNSL